MYGCGGSGKDSQKMELGRNTVAWDFSGRDSFLTVEMI